MHKTGSSNFPSTPIGEMPIHFKMGGADIYQEQEMPKH